MPLQGRYTATVLQEFHSTDDYLFTDVVTSRVMVYRLLQGCVEICSEFEFTYFQSTCCLPCLVVLDVHLPQAQMWAGVLAAEQMALSISHWADRDFVCLNMYHIGECFKCKFPT